MRYLDLFAGAGGLSEGFKLSGFYPVAHIEMDKAACFTLQTRSAYHWLNEHDMLDVYHDYLTGKIDRNSFYQKIPENVLDSVMQYMMSENNLSEIFERIDKRLDGKHLDLIIGGPPCQAYSLAGRGRDANGMVGDSRNYLYKIYACFLEKYQPEYFVFENVLGLLSAKEKDGKKYFDLMREAFWKCGYVTEAKVLDARNYGVLQNRKRLILIGKRGEKGGFYPKLKEMLTDKYTVRDIFSDLPAVHAGEGNPRAVPTAHCAENSYLRKALIKSYDREPVTLHYARPNNAHDLAIYRMTVEKWNFNHTRLMYTDIPEPMRTHKNVSSFLDRFKVVAADLSYSQTVVAHLAKDGHYYIHPDIKQNRSITPREAARIQTFPDNYYFESISGKPSRTYAFKQIGNAVPVLLAYKIAEAVKGCFERPDEYERDTKDVITYQPESKKSLS